MSDTRPDGEGNDAAADMFMRGVEATLARLPGPLSRVAWALLDRWPGRIAIGTAKSCVRIELFDRSMTIAAQLFTSVFPILIAVASWVHPDVSQIAGQSALPGASEAAVAQALESPTNATFGLVGTFIVLVSATSLSRAMTRAWAAIWELPRPKSKLGSAWRWVAVVLGLATSLVVVREVVRLAGDIPPGHFWEVVVAFACDVTVAIAVPWILMAGVLSVRHLTPGALIYATAMAFIRPASGVFLPQALETSASRYGSIGVAFTYLAWLYAIAWVLLVAGVLGAVVVKDRGVVGAWLRGSHEPGTLPPPEVADDDEALDRPDPRVEHESRDG
ncbi:YhjD/YihY/BrkB family envelope integrity protein [Marmoricola sp. RAF53]|uniref:YhjD/YihY/BrkB family envelope integrity protein n=1 Tax=Marmoricola sp. RAF53 TaxID=3233059 RepID=UPI003F968CDF